jgi:hypothetical protein
VSDSLPFIRRFPDREIPDKTESLTVDHRGSGLGDSNCKGIAHRVHDSANIDFPRSEGEIVERELWVKKTPERSWEGLDPSGLQIGEGPGGSGRPLRGRLLRSGIRAWSLCFLKQGQGFHNAAEEGKVVS